MDRNKISWPRFETKHPDSEVAFEDLSLLLFLKNYDFDNRKVTSLANQAGIEIAPIQDRVTGKWISYQSKYSRGRAPYSAIKKSITTACEKKIDGSYPDLDIIEVFVKNDVRLPNTQSNAIKAIAEAQGIEIVWRIGKYFQAQLLDDNNYALNSLFFGDGDYHGFYNSTKNQLLEKNRKNKKKIDINFEYDSAILTSRKLVNKISSQQARFSIVVGGAGSGKTSFMYGLREKLFKKARPTKQQWPVDYVPIFVQLKYLEHQDLSIYLQQKRQDFNLATDYPYIYMLDGLDEISHSRLRHLVSEIEDLMGSSGTRGVIVSGRKSSINTVTVLNSKSSEKICLFELCQLGLDDIERYFNAQNNERKYSLWRALKKAPFVEEIRDVFQLEIFFENIEKFNDASTIADLYDTYIYELLHNHDQENLEKLDILNTKPSAVISLNKHISRDMQLKESSTLELKDLQSLVKTDLRPSSNTGLNEIVDYQEKTFFTKDSSPTTPPGGLFGYRHKRLQDYFLIEQVVEEINEDWSVLRKYRLLSNPDLFNNLLLPKLEKQYHSDTYLHKRLALSMLKIYIGYDEDGFGVYFDELPKVLARFTDVTFNYLLESSGFMFEKRIKQTPQTAYIFSTNGKDDYADKIVDYLKSLDKKTNSEIINDDPTAYFSLLLHRGLDAKEVLGMFNRKKALTKWSDKRVNIHRTSLLDAAFIASAETSRFKDFVKELNIRELVSVSSQFTNLKYLPLLQDVLVKAKLKKALQQKELFVEYEMLGEYLFFKQYLENKITVEDLQDAQRLMEEISTKNSRPVDWYSVEEFNRFACLYWTTDPDFSWLEPTDNGFNYYQEHVTFAQLYSFYIALLQNKRTDIRTLLRFFIDFVGRMDTFYKHTSLNKYLSIIWVRIIESIDDEVLAKSTFDVLQSKSKLTSKYQLMLELAEFSPQKFKKFTTLSQIAELRQPLKKGSDKSFQEEVNTDLDIAFMYTFHDETQAIEIIKQTLDKSLVRHGWHKDIVASILFVDTFLIACEDKLFSKDEIRRYSFEILELLQEVLDISDKDHTRHGPSNLVSGLIRFDANLAKELIDKVREEDHGYIPDSVITQLLIRMFDNFEDPNIILENLSMYIKDRDYEGKVYPGFYFEKLKILTRIYSEPGLDKDIKSEVLQKIINLNKEYGRQAGTILTDSGYIHEYQEAWNVAKDILNANSETLLIADPLSLSSSMSDNYKFEDEVSQEKMKTMIKKIKNKKDLKDFFKRAKHVDWKTQLEDELADKLVNDAMQYFGSVKVLIDYLKDQMYIGDLVPYDATKEKSYYLEQIMVAIVKNQASRAEGLDYLKTAGLYSFYKTYRIFSILDDLNICRAIFLEYWSFVKFLVYR